MQMVEDVIETEILDDEEDGVEPINANLPNQPTNAKFSTHLKMPQ